MDIVAAEPCRQAIEGCGERRPHVDGGGARIVQKPPTITLRIVTHRNNRRTHRPLAGRKPDKLADCVRVRSLWLARSGRWLARVAGSLGSPARSGRWLARVAGFASWLGLGNLGAGRQRAAGVTGAPAYWSRHCSLSDPECSFDCNERDTLLKSMCTLSRSLQSAGLRRGARAPDWMLCYERVVLPARIDTGG